MHTSDELLPIGTFVTVGDCPGVIIGWPDANEIPEEHYAVWYGEINAENSPQCRTVPMEYCVPVDQIEYYH